MIDEIDWQREVFRKRLRLLAGGFALVAAVILLRLGYLQVASAEQCRQQLEAWLLRPPEYLPALRGRILDRHGEVLAEDVPAWQVEAHYGVLAGRDRSIRDRYIRWLANRRRREGRYPPGTDLQTAEELLRQQIAQSWQRLAELTGTPVWKILESAKKVVERVEAMQQHVAKRLGARIQIAEQRQFHPILTDLDYQTASKVRLGLDDSPWLRVEAASARRTIDHPAFSHLLGRLGQVSREHLSRDEHAGDELLGLRPGERVGVSGVEYLAQEMLRGRRGKIVRDRTGRQIERVEPVGGLDVHLTIDAELQRWIYERLGQAVMTSATGSGAAAVVLDTASREVLAAVSWPGYTQRDLAENYEQLAQDAVRMPLLFRAVAGRYPPGSIVKPVTLIAALAEGVVGPEEIIECRGYLTPDSKHWRCWTVSRHLPPHGPLTAEEALMHSCNVYLCTVGARLGPRRLTQWMDMFGLGKYPGLGLKEEACGLLPTPSWLMQVRARRANLADARNYAIGQGEILLTPIQAANMAATLATGFYQPVTLLRDALEQDRPRWQLPGSPRQWQVVRNGMRRVVNDPAGTAYRYARSDLVPPRPRRG